MAHSEPKTTSQISGAGKAQQPLAIANDTVPSRRINIKRIQNVLLIWLDKNIDENDKDCQNTIVNLRAMVNEINTFIDDQECIQFLNSINDEKACMIISGSLGRNILPRIHNMSQVHSIFIFCKNKNYHEQWAQQWTKIKGVFTDITLICDALKRTAQEREQNSISISYMPTMDDVSKKKLNHLEPSFMYTQIMKEILLTIGFEKQHFRQFIHYCREALDGNSKELQTLDKIKHEYRQQTPVWWYTYESFLYPMLNRALRTLDANSIVTLGFFINDLHRQIEQLHWKQFGTSNFDKIFIVYRGQGMVREEFESMTKTKGGLLSFNCFLSTSKKREFSLSFARRAATNPDEVGILFVMNINLAQSTTPFAAVDQVGYYKNREEELLFSMHTIFRVNSITSIDKNQRLFQVDLTLTSDNDPDLRALTNQIREETFPHIKGWYRLGLVLGRIGQSQKAEEVYQILLEQATTESERAPIYQQIGWAKQAQGNYQEAIIMYEKLLAIHKKILPPNHPHLAMSYNYIGSVYNEMGEYFKALSSHEEALAIQQKSLSPNYSDLAMSYMSIGNVYLSIGEYSKALSLQEKALAIQQQSLPPNHPHLASTYSSIGLVYCNMSEYSKALSLQEKALAIRQQSLPANHPHLAFCYNNIGEVRLKIGESSKALTLFEKTLNILQKALPPNHSYFIYPYKNIGMVHEKLGDYSKARSFYEHAIAIGQQSLSPNHSEFQKCQKHLARIKNKL